MVIGKVQPASQAYSDGIVVSSFGVGPWGGEQTSRFDESRVSYKIMVPNVIKASLGDVDFPYPVSSLIGVIGIRAVKDYQIYWAHSQSVPFQAHAYEFV